MQTQAVSNSHISIYFGWCNMNKLGYMKNVQELFSKKVMQNVYHKDTITFLSERIEDHKCHLNNFFTASQGKRVLQSKKACDAR